ncbi:hypothetical protein GLU01_00790 [Nanohaloarchaea archaeon]|jgi:DNA-binding transcriptional ArsR family regulator|nr:hypothetical protein [Candidatus Nanohaloarchaea archaeon]
MPYDESNVVNNRRPYHVMRQISLAGDSGAYAVEISKELDSTQQTVSQIIQALLEKNLLKKGKRTQAQYYQINSEGYFDQFVVLHALELEEMEGEQEGERTGPPDVEGVDDITDLREPMTDFYRTYCTKYFQHMTDSTISKMIYDHPIRSIRSNWKTDRLPDWMRYVLHQIMAREETLQKTPEEIFRESIEETQKN